MTYFFKTLLFLTAVAVSLQAQAQRRSKPLPGGIYLKAQAGRGFSLNHEKMTFNTSGSYADMNFGPGAGFNLSFGTGLRSKVFDAELLLEESLVFGFSASTGSGGSVTSSASFFKTNLYGVGYLKIPMSRGNYFRMGIGPFISFPGKYKAKLDGSKLGYAKYNSAVGYVIDLNVLLEAKTVYVNPGLRFKSAKTDSKEITFTQNQSNLTSLNLSSVDIYLAIQF